MECNSKKDCTYGMVCRKVEQDYPASLFLCFNLNIPAFFIFCTLHYSLLIDVISYIEYNRNDIYQ